MNLDNVKAHVRKNKKLYVGIGVGVVVGAGVALLTTRQITVVDSFKLQWKTNTTNNVTSILVRRGHPGNLVRCVETGEVFASQKRTADVMGINQGTLSKHLAGKVANAGGFTFENLGEAQAA